MLCYVYGKHNLVQCVENETLRPFRWGEPLCKKRLSMNFLLVAKVALSEETRASLLCQGWICVCVTAKCQNDESTTKLLLFDLSGLMPVSAEERKKNIIRFKCFRRR